MKTVAIIQARICSSRLPGKVLYEIAGTSLIGFMIKRLKRSRTIDEIILATGDRTENDALSDAVESIGVAVFRGPEEDVLSRYAKASTKFGADLIVRLTGDCPLIDPDVIDQVVLYRNTQNLDYCTNVKPPTWPDGLDVSVFTSDLLQTTQKEAHLPSDREHVVPWMWRQTPIEGGTRFSGGNIQAQKDWSSYRWTIDEPADYLFLRALVQEFGPEWLLRASCPELIATMENTPNLIAINKGIPRDAGYQKSLGKEAKLIC